MAMLNRYASNLMRAVHAGGFDDPRADAAANKMLTPNTLLPSQRPHHHETPPEHMLLLAVLQQAIADWDVRRPGIKAWLDGEDAPVPFEWCATVLGIDPTGLRNHILARKAGKLANARAGTHNHRRRIQG